MYNESYRSSRDILHPVKSDVIIDEVILNSTNQETRIRVAVKETTRDLVEEGIGEGVGVEGEDVRGALHLNEREKRQQGSFLEL